MAGLRRSELESLVALGFAVALEFELLVEFAVALAVESSAELQR